MDTTNYGQSLMHIIKGNLGAGILAMPATFHQLGLVNAIIGMPFICLIIGFCIHMLISSARAFQNQTRGSIELQYSALARHSFEHGPSWMQRYSNFMCLMVDGALLVTQLGVCCVYAVFVVDNVDTILASHDISLPKSYLFAGCYPIALLLCYIRTLKRLSIASVCANLCQAVGICLVLEYLTRDLDKVDLKQRDEFGSLMNVAIGYGSAMFAFEGISVVIPVFRRMRNPDRMSGPFGVVNVAFAILLALYMLVGLFGYLKFGDQAKGSVTLNLPATPLYDVVRAIFTGSILLTYPLQFYVPNEIIWSWLKRNLLLESSSEMESVIKSKGAQVRGSGQEAAKSHKFQLAQFETQQRAASRLSNATTSDSLDDSSSSSSANSQPTALLAFDYLNRTVLVTMTFALAMIVPHLYLLMDLIGAVTGTALCVVFPAFIHIGYFWEQMSPKRRFLVVASDILVIGMATVLSAISCVASIDQFLISP